MARYNVEPVQDFIEAWPTKDRKGKALAEIELLGDLANKYKFTLVNHDTYELLRDTYREKWYAERGEIDPAKNYDKNEN